MNKIEKIYKKLLKMYGPQGWWPLLELNNSIKVNITKSGSVKGYHPGDYSYPKDDKQKYEIFLGAVLTQNTAWPNVEKALTSLNKLFRFNPKILLSLKKEKIRDAIKPTGYFNQKTEYLLNITHCIIKNKNPSRNDLLRVKGIGHETADSILLYAYKQPEFVVDVYTKRIFSHLKIVSETATYQDIKERFEKSLPNDYRLFQEYHALIVEHAKNCYSKKPYTDSVLEQ